MANYFDQFDAQPQAQPTEPAASGGNFFDQFDAKPAQKPGVIEDVAKAIPSGFAKGVAGLVGLPGLMQSGVDAGIATAEQWITGRPTSINDIATRAKAHGPNISAGDILTTGNTTKAIESATGPLYQAQTVPGQYASTIAEFAPGAVFGGGSLLQRGAQVLAPAIVSETAGQATKGTAWEPYFRVGGALLGGIGTAIAQAPRGGKAILGQNLDGISEVNFNAARAFQAQGADRGVNLTLGEALNQVTGGRGQNISRIERVVANSGDDAGQIMNDFYAARPGQVENVARKAFDDFGPTPANPHTIGPQIGQAAEGIVGDAVSARTQAVSPMYRAAATDTVDPAAVQGLVKEIDALIARDTTGLTHGPLNNLKSSLVAKPATPGTPGARTPVTDPKTGRVIRYDHSPATPGTPAVLANDVENLDRARKYFRDQTDLPQFAPNAIDKETGALITGKTSALDQAMEAASPNFAAGKDAYQAITRKDIEPLMSGPLGQIASRDTTTAKAIEALFPANPLPGSAPHTLEAVKSLSAKSPAVANQLVRTYVERVFNNASKDGVGGPNVNGGAKFVANLKGNSEQAANLRAAIQGLKNGDDILPGFERMLDVLQATGWRPGKGSDTAFNQQIQKQLTGSASPTGFVVEQASKGGLGLPKAITERWNNYRMGKNTEELARILTDPKATLLFKTLANAAPTSAKALMLTARLTVLGRQAAENGNGKR